jgi:hypothetical protein
VADSNRALQRGEQVVANGCATARRASPRA